MPGDGSCLFHSLSYLIHGNIDMSMNIRVAIVTHVIENWERFKHLTYSTNGDNFCTKESYRDAMLNPATYGTTCELVASGEIYPFQFQVYNQGELFHSFGDPRCVKKFRFSGNLSRGHFDVYEMDTTLLRSSTFYPGALKVSSMVQSHNNISYLNSKAMLDTKEKEATKEKQKRLENKQYIMNFEKFDDIIEEQEIEDISLIQNRRAYNLKNRIDNFNKWDDEKLYNRFRLSKDTVRSELPPGRQNLRRVEKKLRNHPTILSTEEYADIYRKFGVAKELGKDWELYNIKSLQTKLSKIVGISEYKRIYIQKKVTEDIQNQKTEVEIKCHKNFRYDGLDEVPHHIINS
ncbi:hypothetical protein CBL_20626 [Carabus blaptoides fortunei]